MFRVYHIHTYAGLVSLPTHSILHCMKHLPLDILNHSPNHSNRITGLDQLLACGTGQNVFKHDDVQVYSQCHVFWEIMMHLAGSKCVSDEYSVILAKSRDNLYVISYGVQHVQRKRDRMKYYELWLVSPQP